MHQPSGLEHNDGQDMLAQVAELVARVRHLAAERAAKERESEQALQCDSSAVEREFSESTQAAEDRRRRETHQVEMQLIERRNRARQRFDAETTAAEREYRSAITEINERCDGDERRAKQQLQEATWLAETVYEAAEPQPRRAHAELDQSLSKQLVELQGLEQQTAVMLVRYHQRMPDDPIELSEPAPPPSASFLPETARESERADDIEGREEPTRTAAPLTPAQQRVADSLDLVRKQVQCLINLGTPRWFIGPVLPLATLMIMTAAAGLAGWLTGWSNWPWLVGAAAAALVIMMVLIVLLYRAARRHVRAVMLPLRQAAAEARRSSDQALEESAAARDRLLHELKTTRDRELREASEAFAPKLPEIKATRERRIKRTEDRYAQLQVEIQQRRDEDLATAVATHKDRSENIARAYETTTAAATLRRDQHNAETASRRAAQWQSLASNWTQGMTAAATEIAALNRQCDALFPAWTDPRWGDWSPPAEATPAIRFGNLALDMSAVPGGVPDDDRLKLDLPSRFNLPATISFPNHCSLLLEAAGDGRLPGVRILQSVMLRLLTSLPPGKVRFTIVDPVGLGQSFAGFMHLADHDEALVGARIWTEPRHIEQRLTDLTEHMENVIQKYLRNEFATIEQYNRQAGEIAEPLRFLVIADLPVHFTDIAAQRLASIISSGARCGVHTLILRDTRHEIPKSLNTDDLRRGSVRLTFEGGRFILQEPELRELPLALDPPPQDEFLTATLRTIGRAAKQASRVEVPFEVIAPPGESAEKLWTQESGRSLRVPLGRAGATKLQNLVLGEDTQQHVLIAGKTGSGKSTLLHALITNLSLWYSPDEVEFYLIDFKKGVEFKTYATYPIPHVRAVAIESDREFGLSVLQGLDAELKHRGNLFRDAGVQDLAGFRRVRPGERMPRTLLIVDEFQELFVEDDKLAQDASLLLDRLVRQGRAFGMHILLGSQTLGGAYTLGRSTMGQMGVRIAMQCSEADSHLILSDDNSAARLLSRPGEAIYNDASGLVEGNSPFQVVWLPEQQREQMLGRVIDLAKTRKHHRLPHAAIVFEGNAPADIARNRPLRELLALPTWPAAKQSVNAWLGEAIAIKDPTAAALRRHSGANLLMIGQRDDAAVGMMASMMISLAAQHAAANSKFYVFDGTPGDDPLAGKLAQLVDVLPHQVNLVNYREVPQTMAELAAELARRQADDLTDAPAIYLLVHGLHRYRMLRKPEDEFSYSSNGGDKPPASDKLYAAIIRDGPNFGLHTFAWCDTLNNLQRTLDRQTLREFDQRVLFQMSATDSSTLIDSPLASRLGPRRALYHSEEHGQLEKFRPYSFPPPEWLEQLAAALAKRSKASTHAT